MGHALPQAPQLFGSTLGSDSQPFVATPSQSTQSPVHMDTVHMPATQPATALGTEQGAPQAPQFIGSVAVSVSQPLASSPSQFLKPVLQLPSAQMPAAQAAVALGGAAQGVQPVGAQPYVGSSTCTQVPLHIFSEAEQEPPAPLLLLAPPLPPTPELDELVVAPVPLPVGERPPLPDEWEVVVDDTPEAHPAQVAKSVPTARARKANEPTARVADERLWRKGSLLESKASALLVEGKPHGFMDRGDTAGTWILSHIALRYENPGRKSQQYIAAPRQRDPKGRVNPRSSARRGPAPPR
jgi:hypothetical protein